MSINDMTLIGMAGAGKSTVGPLLAERCGKPFLDTDHQMELVEGKSLQELLDEKGLEGFRSLEESHILLLKNGNGVISTGGSVVYSPRSMNHLRRLGPVIYLKVPYEIVEKRLGRYDDRALIKRPEQSLRELCRERAPLYELYAHITIDASRLSPGEIVEKILSELR